MSYTWTTAGMTVPLTKKDIIQRLFTDGHIDFNEMWILMQDNEGSKYVGMPHSVIPPPPYIPDTPQWGPGFTDAPIVNYPHTTCSK